MLSRVLLLAALFSAFTTSTALFESTVSLDGPTPPQPGGQAMARPPSTCRWTWNTVWPACALQLNTVR